MQASLSPRRCSSCCSPERRPQQSCTSIERLGHHLVRLGQFTSPDRGHHGQVRSGPPHHLPPRPAALHSCSSPPNTRCTFDWCPRCTEPLRTRAADLSRSLPSSGYVAAALDLIFLVIIRGTQMTEVHKFDDDQHLRTAAFACVRVCCPGQQADTCASPSYGRLSQLIGRQTLDCASAGA